MFFCSKSMVNLRNGYVVICASCNVFLYLLALCIYTARISVFDCVVVSF